jgi:hypothetical protein
VLDGDLVAEEGRCLGAGMRDQGLVLVEFQFEVVTQELGQALLDLPGFGLGPGEPEKVIVGLCRGPDYADAVSGSPGQRGGRCPGIGITRRGSLAVCLSGVVSVSSGRENEHGDGRGRLLRAGWRW